MVYRAYVVVCFARRAERKRVEEAVTVPVAPVRGALVPVIAVLIDGTVRRAGHVGARSALDHRGHLPAEQGAPRAVQKVEDRAGNVVSVWVACARAISETTDGVVVRVVRILCARKSAARAVSAVEVVGAVRSVVGATRALSGVDGGEIGLAQTVLRIARLGRARIPVLAYKIRQKHTRSIAVAVIVRTWRV